MILLEEYICKNIFNKYTDGIEKNVTEYIVVIGMAQHAQVWYSRHRNGAARTGMVSDLTSKLLGFLKEKG